MEKKEKKRRKTKQLTTVHLSQELKMLRSLKALYKYTDKFLTVFSLVDASNRLHQKRSGNL